ncbi:MAG: thioredoxin domain-containing protein [Bdellovibrionales bacterium]|nr:thioredoxin domain-containing protein [Bdellovibrionales bacterium]
MNRPFTLPKAHLNLLTVLGVIALVISIVQTMHFAEVRSGQGAFQSFCTVGKTFDCNAIDASPYSELPFIGIPLAAAAAGWWLAILVFTLLARSQEFGAALSPAILAMTGVGSIFSVFYLWIMIAVIKIGCLLCLGMDAVNFIALGATLHAWRRQVGENKLLSEAKTLEPKLTFRLEPKLPVIGTLICLLITVVFARSQLEGAPSSSELKMRTASILGSTPIDINVGPELPSLGNSAAKVTIVKFSDFQCPSCRVGAQSLHPVLARYSDRVRFVYRNFPLDPTCNRIMKSSLHLAACELSKGSVCAQAQGKFEAYYEKTFENQASLKPGSAAKIAAEVGIDTAQFEKCLSDPSTSDRVIKDIEEGIRLNVESTPTFFINGRRVSGALPPQSWNELIEQMLKQAQ